VRSLPFLTSLLVAIASLASCAAPLDGVTLALGDPGALLERVEGPLRVLVFVGTQYACDPATGQLSPEVADASLGEIGNAVVDVEIPVASPTRAELGVPSGTLVVLVRGRGLDVVSERRDTIVASACAVAAVEDGETVSVRLDLRPVASEGVCGDRVVSQDEQCDDGNTRDADGCSAACRTEVASVSAAGSVGTTSLAGVPGAGAAFLFDVGRAASRVAFLDEMGASMGPDRALDPLLGVAPSLRLDPAAAAVGPSSLAIAVTEFVGAESSIRLGRFTVAGRRQGDSAVVAGPDASDPGLAYASDGTLLLAMLDGGAARALRFEAGSTSADPPIALGAGLPAPPSEVVVAGAADHFVVAFVAAGDAFAQRVNADGTLRDVTALPVLALADGTQSEVAVAARDDGTALVTFTDDGPDGDGDGTSVRGAVLSSEGAFGRAEVLVGETTGDQRASAVLPTPDGFFVAYRSGAGVRARYVGAGLDEAFNRESPPTLDDFEVAAEAEAGPALGAGGSLDAPGVIVGFGAAGEARTRFYPF
jgi:cysteine-rich repeat protein